MVLNTCILLICMICVSHKLFVTVVVIVIRFAVGIFITVFADIIPVIIHMNMKEYDKR